jgi:hypothetical protein
MNNQAQAQPRPQRVYKTTLAQRQANKRYQARQKWNDIQAYQERQARYRETARDKYIQRREERRISYKFKDFFEPYICQNIQLMDGIAWNTNDSDNVIGIYKSGEDIPIYIQHYGSVIEKQLLDILQAQWQEDDAQWQEYETELQQQEEPQE